MAAWIPVIKTALPHIVKVLEVALPMFTAKYDTSDRDALVGRQIEELQLAATRNAESVKELAIQLKSTLEALDAAEFDFKAQLDRQRRLTLAALLLSIMSLCASALLMF